MVRAKYSLRKRWIILLLLLPLLYSFQWGSFHVDVFSIPPNTLVWETVGNPDSMDPAVDNTQFGHWMLSNIYETLYTYPFNSSAIESLVPLLAIDQPSVSLDRMNYTIELRQGVTFHDGTPFNASCVKWNIERAMKIFSGSGLILTLTEVLKGGTHVKDAALLNGKSSAEFKTCFDDWVANSGAIEIRDVYTIRFVLEKPFSPFITLLASRAAFVMSPTFAITHSSTIELETWQAYGVDYGDDENYMNTHTCGTGPYTLFEWIPDQFIRMDLYGDYWRESVADSEILPPPYAGSMTKVYIKTNEEFIGRSLNLRAGMSDGIYWPATEAYQLLDPDEGTIVYENIHVSSGGYRFATTFFGFNMKNITTIIDSTTVPSESPFRNKNFRRTASFAFDYQEFIDVEVNGFGVQGRGPIPIGMSGYNDSSFAFDCNITAAVAEWNLAMQDPEFISSLNSINSTLTFHYIVGSALGNTSVVLLRQGLEDVFWHPEANHTGLNDNMTIIVEGISFSAYHEYLVEGRLLVQSHGWTPDYADPISYLQPLCYSEGELAQQIGFNNTDIDQWYEQAIAEIETSQRQIYLNNIQNTVADEAPYIWAYQELEFRTWRDWISGDGLTFNPMRDIYFYHVIRVYSLDLFESSPWLKWVAVMFLPWISYAMVNPFVGSPLIRRRIKFAIFVICTGLTLFFTAWGILYPFGMNLQPLWVFTLSLYYYPGLLWVPWYLIYNDYKKEHVDMKSTRLTIDLQ